MLKLFLPNEHVPSIFAIEPGKLKEKGIKGIITDLDNTLVAWDEPSATPELKQWFEMMRDNGIVVTIISNNNEQRVKEFSDPVGVPFIFRAKKPMGQAFRRALKDMGLKREEVVVVGDQIMTDVLGANRAGLHTILVVPVAETDGFWTKFNRRIERSILTWMKRKGMIYWEE